MPRVESGYSCKLCERDLCGTIGDGNRDKVQDKSESVTAAGGGISDGIYSDR